MKLLICILIFLVKSLLVRTLKPSATQDLLSASSPAVGAALRASPRPRSSVLIFTDGASSSSAISEVVGQVEAPMGVGVFVVERGKAGVNMTQVVADTRKVAVASWSAAVVVASEERRFLAAFAEASLRCRLLRWDTRLLLVTRLGPQELRALMSDHWTFSMMNVMLINMEERREGRRRRRRSRRYGLYTHLPYGAHGRHQTARAASWAPESGLVLSPGASVFQEKYSNFHGAVVNLTVLPWMPNWKETQTATEDGGNATMYSGTDYSALKTVAETLNFTFSKVRTRNFVELENLVEEGAVFLCPLNYAILLERMERYDFTRWYTFIYRAFAMRTPVPSSSWKSLVTPLSGEVWAAVVVATGLVTLTLRLTSKYSEYHLLTRTHHAYTPHASQQMNRLGGDWYPNLGKGILQIYKTLVGQDLAQRRLSTTATRLVIVTWLAFALIIGVAYRTKLMAALTFRTQPPRPETVEELVQTVDRRQLDRLLTLFVENGLFIKWHRDIMEEVHEENLQRQKEEREAGEGVDAGGDRAITLYHLQGPLCILGLGLGLAGLTFMAELALRSWGDGRPRRRNIQNNVMNMLKAFQMPSMCKLED
ncbi:uncharacterized protein LOC134777767 [Penaeus indicus]|uniref:uncharacterized protein LOC134777767 n=1 Tax=Penaeus indicus TaxID=29960 RepID=UPI00300D2A18